MANYSDLKLDLLDELCDKLDDSGIEGNVIERDSRGRPYVNIWYGSFNDYRWQFSEPFTVLVTDYSFSPNPFGCYEIKPPEKYSDYFKDTFMACRSRTAGFYVMGSDQIVRTIKFLFNREKMEKENKMNKDRKREEAINSLIHELIIRNIIWAGMGVVDGCPTIRIYNNCAIADIHLLATNSEYVYAIEPATSRFREYLKNNKYRCAYTEPRTNDWSVYITVRTVACVIRDFLDTLLPNSEPKLFGKMSEFTFLDELPAIRIVDVIFNDPATIIIWADGTKTVVKAENEKFDPEKGLAMAIAKKVLGNKHDYYEVFKKYVGRYEKKQVKKAKK